MRKFRVSSSAVLIITALLLIADAALGIFLIYRARSSMRSVINERMLGVATTAAAMLDGDELAALTAEDEGGEKQHEIIDKLNVFNDYLNFKYIYIVRGDGEDGYIFIVDPDPDDPAAFGEEVVISPALIAAGGGKATVDDEAISDEWGKYYTAYCPVFTSDGKIGGIVGVDFDAELYENRISGITVSILLSGIAALLVGGGVALLFTAKLRRKFKKLNEDTGLIAADVASLIEDIRAEHGYNVIDPETNLLEGVEEDSAASGKDELEQLSRDVKKIKVNLKRYIDFIHSKAYTDVMTGIGNRAAYFELVHGIDGVIDNPDLRFAVAVFDINGLKTANDEFGHDVGDTIISAAADCIKTAFSGKNVYRIGGDEFVAVLENMTAQEVEVMFAKLDEAIERTNETLAAQAGMPLSLSKGVAEFVPGDDRSYKQVFKRADVAMYYNKNEYYKKYGYRR
ncbi:MAG: diguanylate cyclase [Clostridia bacterium]|nr:diguanylate cyclase [Clostridia bacterium]